MESAGGIVVNKSGNMALVHQFGNSWSFPKGGVEEGETLLQSATREIYEETGIADPLCLLDLGSYERYSIGKGGVGENRQWGSRRRTLFLFVTNQTELVPKDNEVTEAQWFSFSEAVKLLTHPKDVEFLLSVKEKIELLLQQRGIRLH